MALFPLLPGESDAVNAFVRPVADAVGALGLSPSPGERYFRLGAAESPSATFLKVRATRTNGLF